MVLYKIIAFILISIGSIGLFLLEGDFAKASLGYLAFVFLFSLYVAVPVSIWKKEFHLSTRLFFTVVIPLFCAYVFYSFYLLCIERDVSCEPVHYIKLLPFILLPPLAHLIYFRKYKTNTTSPPTATRKSIVTVAYALMTIAVLVHLGWGYYLKSVESEAETALNGYQKAVDVFYKEKKSYKLKPEEIGFNYQSKNVTVYTDQNFIPDDIRDRIKKEDLPVFRENDYQLIGVYSYSPSHYALWKLSSKNGVERIDEFKLAK